MIMTPPGSAKSTYTSICLPPWYVNPEQFPNDLMLACSYSYSLAEEFGRQGRDVLELETKALGVSLSRSQMASGDWRTNKGGGYFCGGVNAGIAGRRGRLGLIDDPIGSEEDANSQVMRDKTWSWYWNDFLPRLWPDAKQILICNRRHEEDLAGRLLDKCADDWHIIKLPMLAEENDPLGRQLGERLWPEWFTEKQVKDARMLPRTWAGLYQQRPAPEEGNFFRKEWIVEYDSPAKLPKNLRKYRGDDFAVEKNEENDRTCFITGGVDENDNLWILPDWFWQKADSLESVNASIRLAREHKPVAVWLGKEVITKAIGPFYQKRMQEENVYLPLDPLSEAKDKQTKAQAIAGRMAQRKVLFPSFAPDWDKAKHELLTFPAGTHDDFVDALAKLGQGLAKQTKARPVVPEEVWNPEKVYVPSMRDLKRSSANRLGQQKRFVLCDN